VRRAGWASGSAMGQWLPLLLPHGLAGRVRTTGVPVHSLGRDNFKPRLDATKPSVGEAKEEIAALCAGRGLRTGDCLKRT
jgi:hypothetical protein